MFSTNVPVPEQEPASIEAPRHLRKLMYVGLFAVGGYIVINLLNLFAHFLIFTAHIDFWISALIFGVCLLGSVVGLALSVWVALLVAVSVKVRSFFFWFFYFFSSLLLLPVFVGDFSLTDYIANPPMAILGVREVLSSVFSLAVILGTMGVFGIFTARLGASLFLRLRGGAGEGAISAGPFVFFGKKRRILFLIFHRLGIIFLSLVMVWLFFALIVPFAGGACFLGMDRAVTVGNPNWGGDGSWARVYMCGFSPDQYPCASYDCNEASGLCRFNCYYPVMRLPF